MRDNCIKEFNKEYDEDYSLKQKEKGRNRDIHVKDMVNYEELKKELELNKKSIEKNNDKIKSINKSATDLKDLLDDLEESKLGGYKLNNQQKERLRGLLKDVESITKYFDNYGYVINNLSIINDNIENQKQENKELIDKNNELSRINRKLYKDLEDMKTSNSFLKGVVKSRDREHLNLVTHLAEGVNSKDYYTSSSYKQLSDKLKEKKIISKPEHRVIMKPLFGISKTEIERAIHHINQEMEEQSEEYFNKKIYGNSNTNENDYTL